MTQTTSRPRLLASYAWDAPGASPSLRAYLHAGAAATASAAHEAGASVVFINSLAPPAPPADLVATADGVVVLGGADVHPRHYGREPETDRLQAIHPHADAFELDLMRAAMAAGHPLLGICRGMQLLNVACGGTLRQDLGEPTIHTVPGATDSTLDHDVTLEAGSRAQSIFGGPRLTVRSDHHQAVQDLGASLTVSARADDGVVEAIEHDSAWAMGVQWHPEDPGSPPGQLAALIAALAGA